MNIIITGLNTPYSKLLSTTKNYGIGKFKNTLTLGNTIETKGIGFFIVKYSTKSLVKIINIEEITENDAIIKEDADGFVYICIGIDGITTFDDIHSDVPLEKIIGFGILYMVLTPDLIINGYKFISNTQPDHFSLFVDSDVYISSIFTNNLIIDSKKYNYFENNKINSYITKINKNTVTEWTKIFTGEISIYDIICDSYNIYITGCYRGSIDIGTSINGSNIPSFIIFALDKNSKLRWYKTSELNHSFKIGKNIEDYYITGESIALGDDGIYVAGTSNLGFFIGDKTINSNSLTPFIIKFAYDSKVLWSYKIDLTPPDDININICPRILYANNTLYMTGFFSYTIQFNDEVKTTSCLATFVLKMDKDSKNSKISIIIGLDYNFNKFIEFNEKIFIVGGFKNFLNVDGIERKGSNRITMCLFELLF